MKYIFTIFLIINSSFASEYFLTAGTFVPYFNKVQVNEEGDRQFFDLNPYLSIGNVINLSGPHFFIPELGYTYYLDTPDKTTKMIFFLHYDFAYALTGEWLLRYGLTNHWSRISGDGGTVRVKNGDGYANFDAPKKGITSYYTTLDLGFEFMFRKPMSVRFDLNMMSMMEQENTAYNYILTINWYR